MARAPEYRLRRIIINVENAAGDRLSGCHVELRRGSTPIGEMISSGRSSVEIGGPEPLHVRASVPGATDEAIVTAEQTEVTLRLALSRFIELASTPTARCPDGTSGQPCVKCIIDGREIEICG